MCACRNTFQFSNTETVFRGGAHKNTKSFRGEQEEAATACHEMSFSSPVPDQNICEWVEAPTGSTAERELLLPLLEKYPRNR